MDLVDEVNSGRDGGAGEAWPLVPAFTPDLIISAEELLRLEPGVPGGCKIKHQNKTIIKLMFKHRLIWENLLTLPLVMKNL